MGMRVNAAGAMMLDSVMDTWATKKGLSEGDVMDAIRSHLFQRQGGHGGPTLRFAVSRDEEGRIFIRAMPRRNEGRDDFDDDAFRERRRPRRPAESGDAFLAAGTEPGSVAVTPRAGPKRSAPLSTPRLDFSAYPRQARPAGGAGAAASAEIARLAYSMSHLPREERRARRLGVFGPQPAAPPDLEPPPLPMPARPPPRPALRDGSAEDGVSTGAGAPAPRPAQRQLNVQEKLGMSLEALICKDEDMGR